MGIRGLLVLLVLVAAVLTVTAVPALGAPMTQSLPKGAKSTADARQGGQPAGASSRLVPVWALVDGDMPVSFGRVSVVSTTEDPAHVGDRRPVVRAEKGSAAAAARPAVVAVWALADGDTPLARARVRILKGGRPIRSGGRERTSAEGVSLMRFKRIPRRFTVEVTPRRGLDGRLRAVVRNYHSARVVHVNPVTTLIANLAAHRRRGRPIGLKHARREVFDVLRIPDWHDHSDLRHSDRYFDGDAYLRAARRAGGVAALNRALLRRALDDQRRAFHNRGRTARAAAIDWLKLLADPAALIGEVFKSLANLAGETAVSLTAGKAGETALGWVLALFGLGDSGALTKADLDQVNEALVAIGKQLTEMKGQIDRAAFTNLVHQTDRTTGQIDHATDQLALLAKLPPSESTKAAFAKSIVDYIGANLLDAPEILDRSLGSNVPLSDNLIKLASRTASTRGRFFDSRDSAAVESVYAYYGAYQARLAILITDYYHAKPDIYGPSIVEANVARLQGFVTAQAASLKPTVPAGTVVDSKTGLMWMQTIDGSVFRPMSAFAELHGDNISLWCPDPRFPCPVFRLTAAATSTGLPGLPFGNWAMPSSDDLRTLLSDRNGDGVDYLTGEVRMTPKVVNSPGTNAHVWISDGFSVSDPAGGGGHRLYFWLFDLRHGAVSETNVIRLDADFTTNPRKYLDLQSQAILYRRVRAPGEDYWWR
jgi:hypothetical protein